MRFELFITRLPKLEVKDLKTKVGDLPPGFSQGVLKKALETNRVPTIAAGWSELRPEIKRMHDRIVTLGGACRIVDHASIFVKAWSAIEGVFDSIFTTVGSKLPQSAPKKRSKPKGMLFGGNDGSIGGIIFSFFVKLALAQMFYLGYATSAMNAGEVSGATLVPRIISVTVGLACAHVATVAVQAALVQRITVLVAAPMVIVPLAITALAYVNLETPDVTETHVAESDDLEGSVAVAELPPPPSHPYQGLIEELRIRKLKASERVFDEVIDDPGAGELPAGVAQKHHKKTTTTTTKPGSKSTREAFEDVVGTKSPTAARPTQGDDSIGDTAARQAAKTDPTAQMRGLGEPVPEADPAREPLPIRDGLASDGHRDAPIGFRRVTIRSSLGMLAGPAPQMNTQLSVIVPEVVPEPVEELEPEPEPELAAAPAPAPKPVVEKVVKASAHPIALLAMPGLDQPLVAGVLGAWLVLLVALGLRGPRKPKAKPAQSSDAAEAAAPAATAVAQAAPVAEGEGEAESDAEDAGEADEPSENDGQGQNDGAQAAAAPRDDLDATRASSEIEIARVREDETRAARSAPASGERPARSAERAVGQRSSYAVSNVEEERIAAPAKRDKR